MSENSLARGRLDSWKEIADYLRCNIRTAYRWEDNGLPVHRVPGGKRRAVFAFKEEIDAWLLSQSSGSAASGMPIPPGQVNGAESPLRTSSAALDSVDSSFEFPADSISARHNGRVSPPPKTHAWKRWVLAAAAVACSLFLFTFAWVFLVRSPKPSFGHISQVTNDGRDKINLRTDGVTLYFNELEVSRQVLFSTPVAGGPLHRIDTPFTNVDLQDVSNDGKRLLVTSFEGAEYDRPLWVLPVQGGPARPVRDVRCRFARWSPDNRRIACAAGGTITLMHADGSSQRVLGPFSGAVYRPLWSPDGTRLRFTLQDQHTTTTSAWEISTREVPEPKASKLDWIADSWAGFTWIDGGKSFVYEREHENSKPTLYVRSEQGPSFLQDRETELPISLGGVEAVVADRDGMRLYLLVQAGSRGQLLRFDTATKNWVAMFPALSADALAYSRDRQWMTYVSAPGNSLWRSRADSSEALRLTSPPMDVELPSWSPDGRQIAFMAREPGKPWRIFLVGRDGGTPQEASEDDSQQGAPTWSPDGKFLAYGDVLCLETQVPCWIHILNLTTRQAERLPGSSGLRTARWSPDGKYIAALNSAAHELMLFEFGKRRWSVLAEGITGDNLNWSSDSKFLYADCPQDSKPTIERIRIADRQRTTAMDLSSFQNVAGQVDFWFGLTPSNDPIIYHSYISSEVYALDVRGR